MMICRRKNQTPEGVFAQIDREAISEQYLANVRTLQPLVARCYQPKKYWARFPSGIRRRTGCFKPSFGDAAV